MLGISTAPEETPNFQVKVDKPTSKELKNAYPEKLKLETILPPENVEHYYLLQEVSIFNNIITFQSNLKSSLMN